MYTKAIAYGRGEIVGLCMSNRAAVFMQLGMNKEALTDCTMAMSCCYPTKLLFKVLHRRALAFLALGDVPSALQDLRTALAQCTDMSCRTQIEVLLSKHTSCNAVASLSSVHLPEELIPLIPEITTHPTLNHASESVCLTPSKIPSAGRGLCAKKDINPGEPIVVEEAFAAVLRSEHNFKRCHHCLKSRLSLFPCDNCSALWCSVDCKHASDSLYHSSECKHAAFLDSCTDEVRLALRVLLRCKNKARSLEKSPTRVLSDDDTVLSLMTHIEDLTEDQLQECARMAVKIIRSLPLNFLPVSLQPDCPTLDYVSHAAEALGTVICQLRTNTYAIFDVGDPHLSDLAHPEATVHENYQYRVAQAVFPTASLLNHSCRPNTLLQYYGRFLVIRASSKISVGDEIFNNYGPHEGHMSKAQRQSALKSQYYFTCCCEACSSETTDSNSFVCPKCANISVSIGHDPDHPFCSICQADLSSCLKQEKKCNFLLDKARESFSESCLGAETISLLEQVLSMQKELYHPHNSRIAETNDMISRAYASFSEWRMAAKYCQEAINILTPTYPENSIEIAMELHKLSQLLFNSKEQPTGTLETVDKALAVFAANGFHKLPSGIPPTNSTQEIVEELHQMRLCLAEWDRSS
ncbi:Smyd4 protein [Pelomyxa schiedti]|nr:Smyd4 protein [Pelomyxa schiedti]